MNRTGANILSLALLFAGALLINGCGHQPISADDDPARTTNFAKLFGHNCAGCHGPDGTHGPAPRIGDPLYLAFAKRGDIRDVLERGRKGTPMPAFGPSETDALTAVQLDALTDGLIKNWGRPVDPNPPFPPYSEEESIKAGLQPGDPERGHAAYLTYCAGCHGTGKGPSPVGAIATPSYVAIASNQALRTTIVVGRPEFGMPDWRHRPPHVIGNQEISDVVAWLATLRPPYSKVVPMTVVPTSLQEQRP